MGRDKNYRSPSNRKRSAMRFMKHLHKMIRISRKMIFGRTEPTTSGESLIKRDNSDILIGHSSDTRSQFWYSFDNFQLFTSTPKKRKTLCDQCWKQCVHKHTLWTS